MTNTAPSLANGERDLLAGYHSAAKSTYDEMLDASGSVRPHWRTLIAGLGKISHQDLALRSARLDRRVRDTGIAYDIFADPNRPSQRWRLDLVPVVISAAEGRWLATALAQRARIFDALLADLYGAQRLLRDGVLPPDLIFSDTAYLRACHDVLPHAGPLPFYAADLARGADGKWRIIDSHTETLAGVGFALANRVAHTQVTSDLFKHCNAVRLAAYFQTVRAALTQRSGRDNARIALLTPGPLHEDYFSHAYLARYLGYLLVEGNDLRTKGAQIYLKTLEGLKEIDLIIRCVDGRSSDPLELDPGGFDGPAGLLRACRKTPALVANPIGAALAQNRGLGPYLPRLARHILGEELMLTDAPRHWLGDPESSAHVLAHLDDFVIRKTQEGTGRPGQAALGQDTRRLSGVDRNLLEREIKLHGARLVAEEKLGFSTAPTFGASGMTPQPFAVRFFVARSESSYETMPGGLAMTVDPGHAIALSAPDGHTRDVWLTGDTEQAPHVSLWRPTIETARVERSQRAIQSRVADDLFWLGRYSERADWNMRVVRSALRRIEDVSGPPTGRRAVRKCLLALLENDAASKFPQSDSPGDAEIERLCRQTLGTSRSARTLEPTLAGLYRVAHLTRDRLSLEAWQTLSKFRPGDTWFKSLGSEQRANMLDALDEGLAALAAFNGLMHENMTRNFGWSFLEMGRRVERAYNLAEAILSLFMPKPDAEAEASGLQLLLELADSFITYRSRYRLDPILALVLDLLLLDEANPRSLAYQLSAVSRHLDTLPDARQGVSLSEDRRHILALLTSIRLADIEAIAKDQTGHMLEKLMREQLRVLPQLSNAMSKHYFNLIDEAPHRLQSRTEPRQ